MKSQVYPFLLFFIFCFSNLTTAQTIKLGEYSGESVIQVSTHDSYGNLLEYGMNCHQAFNIDEDKDHVSISYSLYKCEGFRQWNESGFDLQILDKKIYQNDKEVGFVESDGSLDFTLSEKRSIKETETIYDENCTLRGNQEVSFDLGKSIRYKIQKTNSKTYTLHQEWQVDAIQSVFNKRTSTTCPSFKVLVVGHEKRTSDIVVTSN